MSPRMHLLMRVLLLLALVLLVQTGNTLADFWAVAKRFGVTPLRCVQEGGGRCAGPGCSALDVTGYQPGFEPDSERSTHTEDFSGCDQHGNALPGFSHWSPCVCCVVVLLMTAAVQHRYKWLSQEAGKRFGGIYSLQQQGTAFSTPEAWLRKLNLFDATQQQAAEFMEVCQARVRRQTQGG